MGFLYLNLFGMPAPLFCMRILLWEVKLLKQGCTRNRLIAPFKKFYDNHSVLVDRFKVSVTNIIIDLISWDALPLITYFCAILQPELIPILTFSYCALTASTKYLPNMTIHWNWLYHSLWQVSLVRQRTLGSAFLSMRINVWKVHMLCIWITLLDNGWGFVRTDIYSLSKYVKDS